MSKGGGAGSGPSIAEFCESWNLNEDAVNALLALDPQTSQEVISNFAPLHAENREVNGKLIMFASSVAKQRQAQGKGKGKSVAQFIQDWNLNLDSQQVLFDMTPAVISEVLNSFAPKATDGPDVNGRFINFARSVRGKGPATWIAQSAPVVGKGKSKSSSTITPWVQTGKASGPPSVPLRSGAGSSWQALPAAAPAPASGTVADILSTWNLNEDAQDTLFRQAPDTVAEVLANFAPKNCDDQQVNGKFIMFTNSIAKNFKSAGKGKGESIADFINRWALNEDAQGVLFDLMPNVFCEVVSSFAPHAAEGQEVNGKLIMFAKSVERHLNGTGKGQAVQVGGKGSSWSNSTGSNGNSSAAHTYVKPWVPIAPRPAPAPQTQRSSPPSWQSQPNRGGMHGVSNGPPAVSLAQAEGGPSVTEMVKKWNLNEDAVATLCSVPPAVAAEVLTSFAPMNAGASEVNGKFIMFTRSVATNIKGIGKGKGPSIQEFVDRWALNEDAQSVLFDLPPHCMQDVLNDFAPSEEAREVNGKFIMFARSYARWQKGSGKGKQRYSPY
eukprot:TRINITY_DN102162_c0_g1_i1.p1 TRINITY_DN102162_c0_g1~~TRINITY_DN102162_c0_g1_i1.p1  ORF type:complete len:566 (-),score=92.93 TRINITY_DN102162_c0_g1_i1:35-1693(-)